MGLKYKMLALFVTVIAGTTPFIGKPPHAAEAIVVKQLNAVLTGADALVSAVAKKQAPDSVQKKFFLFRRAYKRAALVIDYYYPVLRKSINGPDLRYTEEDNPDIVLDPHGFQVMERIIFAGDKIDYPLLLTETLLLRQLFISIANDPALSASLEDATLLDAAKASVIRLISLGITGFDSPIARHSLAESVAALEGLREILAVYAVSEIVAKADRATAYLTAHQSFDRFNRLHFIKNYADPLYGSLTRMAVEKNYLLPAERRPVDQFATSIFADDFFDLDFFSPNQRYRSTPQRVELGKRLFYDSILSRSYTRSCATCHDPAKGFTDGLTTPIATGQRQLTRNTPTLLGAAFQTRFFYDSRASTLENQLNSVVHNVDEMDGSLQEGIQRIRQHPAYRDSFYVAYPENDEPVTEYNIANAISSYIRSLAVQRSPFDLYMQGKGSLTAAEKRGFNLFAGKAKCATCHFIPLYNGLVPPVFTETESEVLGVPSSASAPFELDTDEGKFLFTRSPVHRHAFKTATVRNSAHTAPYMHNGVFKTMEELMDFYNKGGGTGLNITVNNQTLPADALGLTKKEIRDIIAFIGALSLFAKSAD